MKSNYYYMSAKTQIGFALFATATVAAAGSYASAATSFAAAGVTATAGAVTFASTGGVGAPVTIVLEVASIPPLITSGICLVAGGVLTVVALKAETMYKADMPFLRTATTASIPDHLGKIAKKYGYGECEVAAKKMKDYLSKHKLNGAIIQLNWIPIIGYIWSDMKSISVGDNGYHMGVLYEGMVYCNIHSGGLLKATWINDFHNPGTKYVTEIPF